MRKKRSEEEEECGRRGVRKKRSEEEREGSLSLLNVQFAIAREK